MGKVVGKRVKEGFVLKDEGGKIYVGIWSVFGFEIRKEEELREKRKLGGWVEKAKKGRKKKERGLSGQVQGVQKNENGNK